MSHSRFASTARAGALVLLVLPLAPQVVEAHARTATFSRIELATGRVDWELRVRLFDLLDPIGLPETADVNLPLARWQASADYLRARLSVRADGHECPGQVKGARAHPDAETPTAAFRFHFDCPATARAVRVHYDLFFDLDPLHAGFAQLAVAGRNVASHVFRGDARVLSVDRPGSAFSDVRTYLGLGVEHIFLGYDHLAFLAALLLAVALSRRSRGDAVPVAADRRAALLAALRLVTAFTAAHSLTLILAALRPRLVPTFWVEPAIALSVAYVGLENLLPRVPRRRWALTFAFGLVHGFGFASVLQEIGLPEVGVVRALLSFNLGVELGQIAVAAVVLPLLIAIARANPARYERFVLRAGSAVLALAGLLWFVSRVSGS